MPNITVYADKWDEYLSFSVKPVNTDHLIKQEIELTPEEITTLLEINLNKVTEILLEKIELIKK